MKLKKVLLMILISTFISTAVSAAKDDIGITINGVKLDTDVAPRITDNRTLVPVRSIFEALGVEVKWDDKTQTVTGIKDEDIIKLQINNKKASINGEEIILDVPAISVNYRTLVPIRFIAENLGSVVEWNNEKRTVVINNNDGLDYTDGKHFAFSNNGIGRYPIYNGPKDIVIPRVIDGEVVRSISTEAFYEIPINSLVIPDTLESIGDLAFRSTGVSSVTIPEGVKYIGSYAFSGTRLTSVNIPESVNYIGWEAFSHSRLTSIKIPKNIKEINPSAFAYNKITSLDLPNSLRSIGEDAFTNNYISSLTLPESVVSVGKNAFTYNHLTSVRLPKSLRGTKANSFDDNVYLNRN